MSVMSGLSEQQIWNVSVAERITSCFSLLCVVFILFTYLFSSGFDKPINRQIFYATWSNLGICVAGLISVDGYSGGIDTPICRFQAFMVQMFLGVDAYWALCMAINVHLAFFAGYNVEQLRSLDFKYLIVCYGASFVPALVFLCIDTYKGPIYGDATLWCWVGTGWDFLRLAIVYAVVWAAIFLSVIVYIRAGYAIYKKRHQLDGFLNPLNETPFASTVVTEIIVTHEDRKSSRVHPEEGSTAGLEHENFDPDRIYSVNVEALPAPPGRSHGGGGVPEALNLRKVTREVAISDANAQSWLYARVAFLFFLALAVTWIPSSINRVYGILNPTSPSFGLSLIAAILLPLQGFWNFLVYVVTSRTACQRLWKRLRGLHESKQQEDQEAVISASDRMPRRPRRVGSGEESLISGKQGTGSNGKWLENSRTRSLGSVKSDRGRGRGGKKGGRFVEEMVLGNIRRQRLGSDDERGE